jgi:hypothetical protein
LFAITYNPTLKDSIPKIRSFVFYQIKSPSMKETDLRNNMEKACKTVLHHALWYVLMPFLLLHQLHPSMKTQKTKKMALMTLNQQIKEISEWSTSLISYRAEVSEQ